MSYNKREVAKNTAKYEMVRKCDWYMRWELFTSNAWLTFYNLDNWLEIVITFHSVP